ncbi:MAG: M23 family metallopeptidase, partial [Vicinamibacterales bacterium]
FEYEIDDDQRLQVALAGDTGALDAAVRPIPKLLAIGSAAGRLSPATPSLFQAMEETGERPQLSLDLAQIFAGEIDFNSELQPDDSFAVAFERWTRDDGAWTYGPILAAEFNNDGRTLRAVRFAPPGGEPAYYDEQGRSLRRFFLKSPLKFEPRITSRFQRNRLHPVLHVGRAHRGVDYGAPIGAPVVAVASGRVVSVSTDAANGRMVRLQHASGYETSYLHLSAFAPGLRRGGRVQQGELIGRVGASGLATGPHLHYGLRKNGVYVDPVREHRSMPPGEPLPASALPAFAEVRDRALTQLARTVARQQAAPGFTDARAVLTP